MAFADQAQGLAEHIPRGRHSFWTVLAQITKTSCGGRDLEFDQINGPPRPATINSLVVQGQWCFGEDESNGLQFWKLVQQLFANRDEVGSRSSVAMA